MNDFIKKHTAHIVGIALGAVGGFLYYYFVGCSNGTCPISSNPYISIVYGAVLGYLFSDLFIKKEKKTDGSN
jgi:hypothetical protein